MSPDSRTVYFTAEDSGNEKLYSTRIEGGRVQWLFAVGNGSYSNLSIPPAADKLMLFANWCESVDVDDPDRKPVDGCLLPFCRNRVVSAGAQVGTVSATR